jgi:hypothetical protein
MGKEAATPSRTWNLLSAARTELVLFLAVTARQSAVALKIKNFFTKWREVQKRLPLPEMTELLITPQLPGYGKLANEVFLLLLDGKLRSHNEALKFLKPSSSPAASSETWTWVQGTRASGASGSAGGDYSEASQG